MRYRFVAPWRFARKSPAETLCRDYLSRICKSRASELVLPRGQPASEREASQFLLTEIEKCAAPSVRIVCLDERGRTCTSAEFANWLSTQEVQSMREVVFCIGGAYGLPEAIAEQPEVDLLALSKMTLPHEMALVFLLEQVFRARCILEGHPYHHGEESPLAQALPKSKKS